MKRRNWWVLLGVVLLSVGLSSCSDEDGDEEGPTDEIHSPWQSSGGSIGTQINHLRLKSLFGQSLDWEQAYDLLLSLGYEECSALPANLRFRVREGLRSFVVQHATPDQVYRNGFRHLFVSEKDSPTLFLELDCHEQSVVSQ
ncbi:MAG: hypothetical protein H6624_07595 [Bdellovibrionaceae bacterium]|nr:hypothetical protein [Bdellovibrionales bacterium]MCB9084193.1 hypothetical protein [Pseudobdellovibrionaceae bacterium]